MNAPRTRLTTVARMPIGKAKSTWFLKNFLQSIAYQFHVTLTFLHFNSTFIPLKKELRPDYPLYCTTLHFTSTHFTSLHFTTLAGKTSAHFHFLHFTTLIMHITLFIKVFGLRGRAPQNFCRYPVPEPVGLLAKEHFPMSVLCLLFLVFQS